MSFAAPYYEVREGREGADWRAAQLVGYPNLAAVQAGMSKYTAAATEFLVVLVDTSGGRCVVSRQAPDRVATGVDRPHGGLAR